MVCRSLRSPKSAVPTRASVAPLRLGPAEEARLVTGMVITIEPGVYLEDVGGVRIEDVVAVTPSGCRVLTKTSRQLRVL